MKTVSSHGVLAVALVLAATLSPELALAAGDRVAGALEGAPQPSRADYPVIAGISARTVAWGLAQMHLFLAAFVLSVPIFSLCTEYMGVVTRDDRYDVMSREFMKITMAAYSLTALVGGALALALFLFYPHLMGYMLKVFRGQVLLYALLFGLESVTRWQSLTGSHVSAVQPIPSSHAASSGTLSQPATGSQVSTVHGTPSSQALSLGTLMQSFTGSQKSIVQATPSSHNALLAVCWQPLF